MTRNTLTVGQIQAQVSAIRKRTRSGAGAFALKAPQGWQGADRMEIDGLDHLVMTCCSELEMREALLRAGHEGRPAVLLCSIGSDQLGDDVLARLAKHRVFAPQSGEILAELFSARVIDPRVLSTKPLVEALLDRAPPTGYRPAGGGVLDLQQAWAALIQELLGAALDVPSLSQMLEWSMDSRKVATIASLDPLLKQAFVDWFSRTRGESIRFMMAAIDAGVGADLVALGLALELVFSPDLGNEPAFHAARARLENYFGGKVIDPESAQAWFRASEGLLPSLLSAPDPQLVRGMLKRLDALFADLKLTEFAHFSDHSPTGLAARFDLLGKIIQACVQAKGKADSSHVRAGIERIRRHILAPTETDRIDRAEMALRLVRWLRGVEPSATPTVFPDLMDAYHRDGGFIDWARNRVRETDVSPALQLAYTRILEQVDARMAGMEKQFAEKLSEWTRSGHQSRRFFPVEEVLARVVVPVAKDRPVLLLVLDGMSVAVFRQILSDIERQGWTEMASDVLGLPSPVLAALPSVTQVSRRALFLGRLEPGGAGTEKGEFAGNDLLFQSTGGQNRPRLFLKGDLQEEGGGGLSSQVRDALGDRKCRVVGVVVNAIDDHLDSGDQVVFNWSVERIKPLRELLKLAADAERTVLLTSDHGHVLDFGSRQINVGAELKGDRHRPTDGPPMVGETAFEGDRVEKALGQRRVVLAWDTTVRYGTKKRGYHGGANPQEMVVPLAVLAGPGTAPTDGWREVAPYEPLWWGSGDPGTGSGEARDAATAAKKVPEAVRGLDLFEQAAAAKAQSTRPWVDALLDSHLYAEQSKLAVRGAPPPEVMAKLLGALESRGGSIMRAALAQVLGLPLFRIDGLVQNVSRILNVDGYEVISFDRGAETIVLNITLLKTQFEIK